MIHLLGAPPFLSGDSGLLILRHLARRQDVSLIEFVSESLSHQAVRAVKWNWCDSAGCDYVVNLYGKVKTMEASCDPGFASQDRRHMAVTVVLPFYSST